MKKLLVIGLLLASCSLVPAFGREFGDSLRYRGEIGVTFSDGAHTPFWMVSDHYGFSGLQKIMAGFAPASSMIWTMTRDFPGAQVSNWVALTISRRRSFLSRYMPRLSTAVLTR